MKTIEERVEERNKKKLERLLKKRSITISAKKVKPQTCWKTLKRQRTTSLTDKCWSILTKLAKKYEINRSEVVEIITRLSFLMEDDLIAEREMLRETKKEEETT